jgi:dienelactone hydrolase
MIETKVVVYQCGEKLFKGFLAHDSSIQRPKPAVIIAHAWRGQDDFAREKAKELAKLGYVGFAADYYGEGKTVNSDEEAFANMSPLFLDRQLLRDRINAGLEALIKEKSVDRDRLGAIGFCFGGLTAIELLKSGAKLKGVVTFHALLGNKLGPLEAIQLPIAPKLHGSLLVLHGYLDPSVSKQDIENFQVEMTKAEVDWQMHIYGNATHAFTNPEANNPEKGFQYNLIADQRSWQSMVNFFNEIFNKRKE